MRPSRIFTLLLALALGAAPGAAADQRGASRKIDRALRESLAKNHRTQNVIVSVVPGCEAIVGSALRRHGDVVRAEHPLINALSVEAHSEDIDGLAGHPCVEAVAADAEVTAAGGSRDRRESRRAANVVRETLGLRASASSDDGSGKGVGIVLIDSGIAPSSDFQGRVTAFYDFTRGGRATSPYDDYGHGTHVAGLIAGSGRRSQYEFQGVAPAADLIVMKVLDRNGRGRTSDVIRAIEFAIAHRDRLDADIINLSLGHPIYAPAKDDPLVRAVERASAAGLIVVVSAGNAGRRDGYTGITSPGNAPSAITVGATAHRDTVARADDEVAEFSSRGPTWFDAYAKPDVVAPGHDVLSGATKSSFLYQTLRNNRARARNGSDLLRLSGTSLSTAITSGVVALMLEQHREHGSRRQKPMTANLVKALLQFSAVPVAGADLLTQGAGAVNAAGALALAGAVDTSVRPGEMWLKRSVTPSTAIGGRAQAWSQRVIWGEQALTGTLVYYNLPQWSVGGAAVVWGSDDNIIWGTLALVSEDNIIWGTTHRWAANLVWRDRIVGLDADSGIIWGTGDAIIWGALRFDNIIWGTWHGDDIIWGTWDGDNIIWGTDDNVIWGTFDGVADIIWGTFGLDDIIWGTAVSN